MSLVADAGHNFGDVLSLVFSWIAIVLAKKKPTQIYTYGFRRTTILAALLNAIILLISLGIIGWEAFRHLQHPVIVSGKTIMVVSAIGILINAIVAYLFYKDREKELNMKSAFLHMVIDALISLGVVIGGVAIFYTHWYWIDSVLSFIIILIVLYSTWKMFVESVDFALDAVPKNIKFTEVHNYLFSIDGVEEVHDLHIWGVSTTEIALTVHLVMPKGIPDEKFIFWLSDELNHHFGIEHSTIQVEQIYGHEGHHKGY
jgi:cobalt-zinc-cadmium efflux system protein